MWPSAYLHGVGTPVRISISRLNTRPACSPVNASPPQLPAPTHDSGPLWVATPSTFRTCIYCTAPISPAHGEREKERFLNLPVSPSPSMRLSVVKPLFFNSVRTSFRRSGLLTPEESAT